MGPNPERLSQLTKVGFWSGVASAGLVSLVYSADFFEEAFLIGSAICAVVSLALYVYLWSQGARPPAAHLALCLPLVLSLLSVALWVLLFPRGGLRH